eukprot:4575932-Prymnesium_polylepis.1
MAVSPHLCALLRRELPPAPPAGRRRQTICQEYELLAAARPASDAPAPNVKAGTDGAVVDTAGDSANVKQLAAHQTFSKAALRAASAVRLAASYRTVQYAII